MTLNELFKNTTYDDTLFSVEAKSTIESRIFMKSVRGNEVPYITCAIRDKEIKLTPEEAVRQLYIYKLMNDYGNAGSRGRSVSGRQIPALHGAFLSQRFLRCAKIQGKNCGKNAQGDPCPGE